jgi:hypothetical protein
MRWWKANESYLIDRTPVASVGLVWSQRNADFFGRDAVAQRVDAPYTGFMHALVRARIPYLPIHADDIERDGAGLAVLILPNVGALSDAQVASVRRFVRNGGSLVATGDTSLYDEWGDPRPDFALADLFACHPIGGTPKLEGRSRAGADTGPRGSAHTYLRLATGTRHAVLRGFAETDILAFGGSLAPLKVEPAAVVPLTFVPAFPTYPPETAWMRQPATDIPALVLSEHGRARVAYMPADIDRRYASEHLPDHAALLANVVGWAAGQSMPLIVEGAGLIDCHLYRQSSRTVLHLVNLTSEATWRAPLDELIPVGPFTVKIHLASPPARRAARLLVSGRDRPVRMEGEMGVVTVDAIRDHEVIAMD